MSKPRAVQAARAVGHVPPRAPAHRVCAEPKCETVLSVYNHLKWCSKHEGEHGMVRTRGKS